MTDNPGERAESYSVVVPVFNAEATLVQLKDRLADVLESLGGRFEIIFVDDGSRDRSWEVIRKLAESDPRVTGLSLTRNFGQANATFAGLRSATGIYLITIDDDLQNPPEEIPILVQALKDHPETDVVFGVPKGKEHPFWRRVASDLLNKVNHHVFKTDSSLKFTSFRLMRRRVVEPLFEMNVPILSPGALLCMVTERMRGVEVRHDERAAGRSGYSLSRLLRVALSRYTGFSVIPLRFLAVVGFVGVVASMVLGGVMVFKFITGQITVPGWTTVVLLLIGIMGFNFLALGILGEYLQNVLLSVRRTPVYLVRERAGGEPSDQRTQRGQTAVSDLD